MGTSLVSSRVSPAKKEAVGAVLSSLGATTSDLINDAFDYVLAYKQLPTAKSSTQENRERKEVSMRDFAAFNARSTLNIAWPSPNEDALYEDALRKGKAHDYESLA